MFFDLFQSFIVGFGVAALPGVVFFETIRRTLEKHSYVGYYIFGNMIGICTVIGLAYFGASALLATSSAETVFYIVCGIILMGIGLKSALAKPVHHKTAATLPELQVFTKRLSSFFTGYILAVANPINILFWVVLMGTFVGRMSVEFAFANIASVLLGTIVLLLLLVGITLKMESLLSGRLLLWLTRIFGGIICAYGVMMIVRGVFS